MIGYDPTALYKEGICESLDEKFREYRKTRMWQGMAVNYALTEKEVDVMAELWRKQRQTCWKMTFHEVSTLIEFKDRIIAWRRNKKREQTRQRMERLRTKRKTTAMQGIKKTIKKSKGNKKHGRKTGNN